MRFPSPSRAAAATSVALVLPILPTLASTAGPAAALPTGPQAAPTSSMPSFDISKPGTMAQLRKSGLDANTMLGTPSKGTFRAAAEAKTAAARRDGGSASVRPSQWNIVYTPDTQASPAQVAALQRAVNTWSQLIDSPVPITLEVTIDAPADPSVLGAAGPESLLADDVGGSGVIPNTFYPVALANALTGTDLNGSDPEIVASFSNEPSVFSFSSTPVAGQFDFETVALHEIAHGLGFIGSMEVYDKPGAGLVGGWDVGGQAPRLPFIFDRRVIQTQPRFVGLFALGQDSRALAAALTTGSIAWSGPNVRNLYPCVGFYPPLFSPGVPGRPGSGFVPGTSYSHLDEATFRAGTRDSLMTPLIDTREVLLEPGPVVLAMLRDLGWKTAIQPASNALSACAPRALDLAARGVVQGNAPVGSTVDVYFKLPTEPKFVLRRKAVANAEGRWATTFTSVGDWAIVAAQNGKTVGGIVSRARPKIGAPPLVRVRSGTRVTFTGRGIPGTIVTLRQRLAGDRAPGFGNVRRLFAPASGVWRYTTVLTKDRLMFVTGANGQRSTVVTRVDVV